MKKILTLLSGILPLFFLYQCGGTDLSTPEGLAKGALESLKTGNFSDYAQLVPSVGDLDRLFERMKNEGKLTDKQLQRGMRQMEKTKARLQKELKEMEERYNKVRGKGVTEGIKWAETRFLKADYKVSEETDFGITIKTADIYFNFAFQDSIYRIKLNNCGQLSRGWLVTGGLRWRGFQGKLPKDVKDDPGKDSLEDQRDRLKVTLANMKTVGTAIMAYLVDNYSVPVAGSVKEIMQLPRFIPFYLKSPVSKDGWDYELFYQYSADKKTYKLASGGRDGIFNGWNQQGQYRIEKIEDFDRDIIFADGIFVLAPAVR